MLLNNIAGKIGQFQGVTFNPTTTTQQEGNSLVGTVIRRPNQGAGRAPTGTMTRPRRASLGLIRITAAPSPSRRAPAPRIDARWSVTVRTPRMSWYAAITRSPGLVRS